MARRASRFFLVTMARLDSTPWYPTMPVVISSTKSILKLRSFQALKASDPVASLEVATNQLLPCQYRSEAAPACLSKVPSVKIGNPGRDRNLYSFPVKLISLGVSSWWCSAVSRISWWHEDLVFLRDNLEPQEKVSNNQSKKIFRLKSHTLSSSR